MATIQRSALGSRALFFLCVFSVAAHAAPPVIKSITPNQLIQNTVPQPSFTITGSGFVAGFPIVRPTVMLRLQANPATQFSMVATTANASGTTLTLKPGTNTFNLLNAPLGTYDLIVSRPDGQSGTLPGAFTVKLADPATGIHINRVSSWGGPISDIDVVGDLAYVANGRVMRILNISDPAHPVELGNIDLLGVAGVRVRDGFAIVAARHPYYFCVVDVSNPAQPTLVWNMYGIGADIPEDIRLHGNLAYVRSESSIVRLYDITDPHNVVYRGIVSDVATTFGLGATAFDLVGDRLYVGTDRTSAGGGQTSELRIYDLSVDPLLPSKVGSVASLNGGEYTTGICVQGNHAAWMVRNVNDPSASTTNSTLFTVDVSNPAAPTIAGSYSNFNLATDVVFSDGFVYAADQSSTHTPSLGKGMAVFDARDPAHPTLTSNYKPHGSVAGLRVIGSRAYLFDEGEGLIIMDISNPATPVRLGNYHSPSTLRRMAKDRGSDLLYIADAWNGFTILNVADSAHPNVVGAYLSAHFNDLGGDAFGIAHQDHKIYLGSGHLGLEVVNVSNPVAPAFLGAFRVPPLFPPSIDPTASFGAVAVSGNIAYVGFIHPCGFSYINFLLDLDIGNPQSITERGRLALSGCGSVLYPPTTIALDDRGHAFISRAANSERHVTTDVSDPSNPALIGTGSIIPTMDVAIDGNTLYIANDFNDNYDTVPGVYVQDVTNPTRPVPLAYINQNWPLANDIQLNSAYAVAVQNHRLYVSADGSADPGNESIFLFDVTDPASPVFLDVTPSAWGNSSGVVSSGNSTSLLVEEPHVYSTFGDPTTSRAMSMGLTIFEVQNLPPLPNPGDLNEDGSVDVFDLFELLDNWGTSGPGANLAEPTSIVDALDLCALLDNWG